MIEIQHLSFNYKDKEIFKDFSLCIDKGISVITGPSGRGKTTLLRLIAGLESPQNGQISVQHPTVLLFQENRLFPSFTCMQQLQAFTAKGTDVLPYLTMVELEEDAHMPVEKLSGGMQRRLSLARALALLQKDDILLMDEPFTGVDTECTKRIFTRIRQLGNSVVFTAHDHESIALADREIKIG